MYIMTSTILCYHNRISNATILKYYFHPAHWILKYIGNLYAGKTTMV